MKLPRKTVYSLLLAFAGINLAVRYPRTPHGIGVDSFSFQVLTDSIVRTGHAAWLIHPLSPFGLFPLSYPSGSFFLTASVVVTGGISIEVATLLLSLFVGAFAVFTAFVMARVFVRDDLFSLVVALVLPLMPKLVTNTLWELPARGFLLTLTPLFVWAALSWIKRPGIKQGTFAVLIFLLMGLFHRLAVLLVVVFFAFLVTSIFVILARIVRLQFPHSLMSPSFQRRSRVLQFGLYASVVMGLLFGSGVLGAYNQGAFYTGTNPLGELANLAVSLGRSVGTLLPLGVVGIVAVVFKRNKAAADFLFLSSALGVIPTLFLRSYTGYYIVTFFALFVAAGCIVLLLRVPKGWLGVVLGALIVIAAASAAQSIAFELPKQSYMSNAEYTAGIYCRYETSGTIASNDGLLGSRVAFVSSRPYLPIGGATTAQYGPEAMAFGFVRGFSVTAVSLRDLTVDADSLFIPQGVTVGDDWSILFTGPMNVRTERIAQRYDVHIVLENSTVPAIYYAGWGVNYDSLLLNDIYETRYKIYETDQIRIWQAF